ncbi:hypothetical protein PVK06_030013 [Gossypium arboreum]|uniref:Zinc knuckle CX2CX4HX4C domain-containing protein n=1 Tax=Gossypium arboreum TaxID=29729 RepID=A0ABR0NM50_GOSAR|nr:hypothetical protein PVK06_030013 [Gossypium arboreum]
MEEGGGEKRESSEEISLLAKELIQLSVKSSRVVPNDKPTLICSVWTKKSFNPESFRAQMKRIWKTKKKFEIQLKPLRRGIFVLSDNSVKSWISFKYEKLPIFCFGCGRIRHSLNDCLMLSPAEKNKVSIDPPYSIALKAESTLVGKESMKLNAYVKMLGTQVSYTGHLVNELGDTDMITEPIASQGKVKGGRKLASWLEGLQEQETNFNKSEIGVVNDGNMEMGKFSVASKKSSWKRLIRVNQPDNRRCKSGGGEKRKFLVADGRNVAEVLYGDGVKRLKVEHMVNQGEVQRESVQRFSKLLIDFLIKEDDNQEEWRFTGFYGSPYLKNKNNAWDLLRRLGQEHNHHWLVGGDFNEILYSFEKSGGVQRDQKRIEAFREERDDEILARIIDTKIHLNMEIDKDKLYWKQRARANWLQFGDKNSAYFHNCVSARRRENTISKLVLDDKREITDESGINENATWVFQELFTSKAIGDSSYLLTSIERSISHEANEVLSSLFREEEI